MAVVAAAISDVQKPWLDYVAMPEPSYGWEDTGVWYDTVLGGKAYKLNVTSVKWLDMDRYKVVGGIGDHSVWKHEVIVIEPRKILSRNTTLFYLASATAGCMNDKPITNPFQNVDTAFGDVLAQESGLITVVAFQVPNCYMVFADDPDQKHRNEDSQLAWSLGMFLESLNPLDMLIFPMAKATLSIAKAVTEYQIGKGNLDEGAGTIF